MADSLGEALDGARLVMYDMGTSLTLAWFGNEYIRVFNYIGVEVSAWSMGRYGDPGVDNLALARESMSKHINDGYYPS